MITEGMNLSLFSPVSEWKATSRFPDLSGAKEIAVDVETKDPLLKKRGPGSIRRDGFPVGIALAAEGFKAYYPFRHLGGGNLDQINVVNYVKDQMKRPEQEKIFANAPYDIEWLDFLGIEVKGRLRDVQIAEVLMDEEQDSYALDKLGKKYLGEGKDEKLLREAAEAYGVDPKAELWKLPSKYIGPYAEGDVDRTLRVWHKQRPLLINEGLFPIFNLETDITPIVWQMRKNGVRIDLDAADKLSKELVIEENALHVKMKEMMGQLVDVWSPQVLGRICEQHEIPFERTPKGNASFNKIFLKNSKHPFLQLVLEIRDVNRLREVYVNDLVNKHVIRGRVHGEFVQVRGDRDEENVDGGISGTRTGRFASRNPNLQQIPARNKKIAKLIRALFLPEVGELWNKNDYSQQEPRIMTHFACLMNMRGADKVRSAYLDDKKADFYMLVAGEAKLERKPAKDLTLGRIYGEGKDKMARDLGISVEEALRVLSVFDNANPFVKELADHVAKIAEQRGFIKTLLGRQQHFNFWEPANWKMNPYKEKHRLDDAKKRWPDEHLRRAFLYKALNKLIQGSAADMTKQAMLMIYQELKRVPLLQVHDELDYSVPGQFEAASIQYRMENCVDITVPMWAESELKPHWSN